MIRYSPYWLDTFPKSRRPAYPRWRGTAETTVVVIGGGLTGCACAYSLAAAGIPVMLLEADRMGGGATAASLGFVREDFDASFEATARAHGLRSARLLWQGVRRASLDFAAALRRLRIRCDLDALDLLRVSRPDAGAVRRLRREYQSRRDAGLPQTWISASAAAARRRTRGWRLDQIEGIRHRPIPRVPWPSGGSGRKEGRDLRTFGRRPRPRSQKERRNRHRRRHHQRRNRDRRNRCAAT